MSHTPAHWAQHEVMQDCVTFHGKHGIENLFLQNLDGYYACQSDDDARLISAAPDLLETLDELLGTLLQCFPDAPIDSVIGKNIINARAAIEKATGETP